MLFSDSLASILDFDNFCHIFSFATWFLEFGLGICGGTSTLCHIPGSIDHALFPGILGFQKQMVVNINLRMWGRKIYLINFVK